MSGSTRHDTPSAAKHDAPSKEAKHEEFHSKQDERQALAQQELYQDTPEQAETRNLINTVPRMTHVAQSEEDLGKRDLNDTSPEAFSLAAKIDPTKVADEKKLRAGTGSSKASEDVGKGRS